MAFNNNNMMSGVINNGALANDSSNQEVTAGSNSLNMLNNLGKVKPWIKASEMEVGKMYRILGVNQMQSKFDPSKTKTILELEVGYLSLPARFDNLDPQTFEWLHQKPDLAIVNNGPVGKTYKLEFKSINVMDFYNSIQSILS